jgi:hypothetical protein
VARRRVEACRHLIEKNYLGLFTSASATNKRWRCPPDREAKLALAFSSSPHSIISLRQSCLTGARDANRLRASQTFIAVRQSGFLELAADPPSQRVGLRGRVQPQYPYMPSVRMAQPLKALYYRRFARAVLTQNAEYLAAAYAEGYSVYRFKEP